MKRLTKAEEEIMQIIWRLGACTVRDIREAVGGDDLPPHSSISTIVRILEQKDFVQHKAYGRTYEYFPKIAKEEYGKYKLQHFVDDYFDGSMNRLVSFMVEKNDLSVTELNDLLKKLDDEN